MDSGALIRIVELIATSSARRLRETIGVLRAAARASIWNETNGMIGLGTLAGTAESSAWSVSSDGSVVVGSSFGNFAEAFIWTPESGMRALLEVLVKDYGLADQLAGWDLQSAYGVSADGNPPVIGPQLIQPVPEPSTFG